MTLFLMLHPVMVSVASPLISVSMAPEGAVPIVPVSGVGVGVVPGVGLVPGAAVLPGVPAVPGVPLVAEVPFVLAPEVLLASGVPCVPPVLPGAVSAGASVAGGGVVCAMASEPSAIGILHAVVKIKRFMCFSFCLTEMVISPLANLVPAARRRAAAIRAQRLLQGGCANTRLC